MTETEPAAVLPFGAFLGDTPRTRSWGGVTFSEVVDRADQNIPRHTHSDAHFFFLLRGKYLTDAEGADGVCSPSTLLFLPRWTTHRDHFVTRGGSFFAVSIEPDMLERVLGGTHLAERATVITSSTCHELMYHLYREFRNADTFSAPIMSGLAIEMLAWAARDAAPAMAQRPAWLKRAVEEISDSLETSSVTELAERAGVHPLHFARTFRRFHHCSPGEYLRQQRCEKAVALLVRTRVSIAEIALRCGFADQSQLTKAVRRYSGMTPAEVRRLFAS